MRTAALLALLATLPSLAAAEVPDPICGTPQVIAQVIDTLRRAGQPMTVEAASAGQRPTARANVVLCAVRVHRLIYDTNQAGTVPRDEVSVFEYTLEMRRNGVFLRPVAG